MEDARRAWENLCGRFAAGVAFGRNCIALAMLTAAVFSGAAWSLTIVSPRPGEQVMPGQSIWLIIQPDNAAEADMRAIQILAPGAQGCENVQLSVPIQCQLTVPDGSGMSAMPTAVDIRVQASFSNGTEARASTHLTVAVPATTNETLMDLRGDARELPLVFDAINQEKDLTVLGESVDGTTRDLRGRSQGTRYDVRNPAVVAVRNDGRVVAQGIGTTTIIVRNGALSFKVPVIVRAGKAGR